MSDPVARPRPTATRVMPVDAAAPGAPVLEEAARVISGGGIVTFPTEGFYGLGADAGNAEAVARVFAVKGRPESKPLLVLVDSPDRAMALCREISAGARALMARHWPGPLTVVLRALPHLPAPVVGARGGVGLRVSSDPVAAELVRRVGGPITATSANRTGEAPATVAARAGLPGVALVLDDGEEEVDLSDYEDYTDALGQLRRFLNDVYMHKRIHSALGYLTPVEFEERWRCEHKRPPDVN